MHKHTYVAKKRKEESERGDRKRKKERKKEEDSEDTPNNARRTAYILRIQYKILFTPKDLLSCWLFDIRKSRFLVGRRWLVLLLMWHCFFLFFSSSCFFVDVVVLLGNANFHVTRSVVHINILHTTHFNPLSKSICVYFVCLHGVHHHHEHHHQMNSLQS